MAVSKRTVHRVTSAERADRALVADIADRARIADAALDLVDRGERRTAGQRKSGEEFRSSDKPGNGKRWVSELLNPSTILYALILFGALVGTYVTITARLAAIETSIVELKERVRVNEQQTLSDSRNVAKDTQLSMARLSDSQQRADDRLWQDVNQLRSRVLDNTFYLGQAYGRGAVTK